MDVILPNTNNPYRFQTSLISGLGPYNDPLSIYSAGHKTYSANLTSSTPEVSGIIENIDIIAGGIESIDFSNSKNNVKLFKQSITEDNKIENIYSGLSIDLKFTKYNVEVEENIFINL